MFEGKLADLNEDNRLSFPLSLSHEEYLLLTRAAALKGMGRNEFVRRCLIDIFVQIQKGGLDLGLVLPVEVGSGDKGGKKGKVQD